MRLEALSPLKNLINSSGIGPESFLLVVYCLNYMRYRVPPRVAEYLEEEKGKTWEMHNEIFPNLIFDKYLDNQTEENRMESIRTMYEENDKFIQHYGPKACQF